MPSFFLIIQRLYPPTFRKNKKNAHKICHGNLLDCKAGVPVSFELKFLLYTTKEILKAEINS